MRRATFAVRKPHGMTLADARRNLALSAEVDRLKARGSWWRRAICRVASHRPWRTGLGGRSPEGTLYHLTVCRRCGHKWAELGEEVAP